MLLLNDPIFSIAAPNRTLHELYVSVCVCVDERDSYNIVVKRIHCLVRDFFFSVKNSFYDQKKNREMT